jgi:hypothetical protein
MTGSTEWVGRCRMCDWSTQTLPNEVLAGMQAFVHERVEDYQHDVQVGEATA